MSAALISSQKIPVATTDSDFSLNIRAPDQDWTGDTIKVAFARQGGVPPEAFEITVNPTLEIAVPIRLTEDDLKDLTPGTWTAAVRRITDDETILIGEFRMLLFKGISTYGDEPGAGRPPVGGGSLVGDVMIVREYVFESLPYVNQADLSAAQTTFNDALTMLGVDNVQDAIVALYALIGSGPIDPPDPDPAGWAFDFSSPDNSALIGAF